MSQSKHIPKSCAQQPVEDHDEGLRILHLLGSPLGSNMCEAQHELPLTYACWLEMEPHGVGMVVSGRLPQCQ